MDGEAASSVTKEMTSCPAPSVALFRSRDRGFGTTDTRSSLFEHQRGCLSSVMCVDVDPALPNERSYIFVKQESNMIIHRFFTFGAQISSCIVSKPSTARLLLVSPAHITLFQAQLKHTIDYSQVPKLNEDDLEEQFVGGHGPGGSNVNKRSNCVVLIHKPSGIVIKCHQSRLLDKNRKIARELLVQRLDQELNGENSVANQNKLILEKKSSEKERRRKKLESLKSAWKEREGIQ